MRYSSKLKYRKYVESDFVIFWFFVICKKVGDKYCKKLMDTATKRGIDAANTVSKGVV